MNWLKKRWADLTWVVLVFLAILLFGARATGVIAWKTFAWWAAVGCVLFAAVGVAATFFEIRGKRKSK